MTGMASSPGSQGWRARRAWLRFLSDPAPACASPEETARAELACGCRALGIDVPAIECDGDMGEGYALTPGRVKGGATGVLYGAYAYMLRAAAGLPLPEGLRHPMWPLRMLDAWDNLDGSVERGYAGRSIWFESGAICPDPDRVRQLGRLLSSVGINALCVNNVNVGEAEAELIDGRLDELAAMARLLRPYAVRLLVSVDFAHPVRAGLDTADPLDARVCSWWARRAERIYAEIPDLAGFVVKADSEHRPGPFTYGRTHADGANMLARALKPHGGVLIWRAFVYNCRQDWRDAATDRPKAAYETYAPLDGRFDDNVILQVKHGPWDFQVREPISPTLLAMPNTALAMELQLAQEYTGQQIDLYAMHPMWRELIEDVEPNRLRAVAAVGNLGRDDNWTGHPLAAANLFGYGCFAWDPYVSAEQTLDAWVRLSYDFSDAARGALTAILLRSREVYEKYTAPLGLGWMVTPHTHYGPSPEGYEYDLWGTYHRADREAVGVDRTARGTGFTLQYPPGLRERYESPERCPDNLKLFFHRLRYDDALSDGRTLIQWIYDSRFEGAQEAERQAEALAALPFPEPDRSEILERARRQVENAREWRDVINTYFHRLSGREDAGGRKIYP